jgi:hypothetical protein
MFFTPFSVEPAVTIIDQAFLAKDVSDSPSVYTAANPSLLTDDIAHMTNPAVVIG